MSPLKLQTEDCMMQNYLCTHLVSGFNTTYVYICKYYNEAPTVNMVDNIVIVIAACAPVIMQ